MRNLKTSFFYSDFLFILYLRVIRIEEWIYVLKFSSLEFIYRYSPKILRSHNLFTTVCIKHTWVRRYTRLYCAFTAHFTYACILLYMWTRGSRKWILRDEFVLSNRPLDNSKICDLKSPDLTADATMRWHKNTCTCTKLKLIHGRNMPHYESHKCCPTNAQRRIHIVHIRTFEHRDRGLGIADLLKL